MLIFWSERLVFLATPKTGTTAIEMALRPAAGLALTDPPVVKHTPLYRYRRFLVPYLEVCGAGEMETMALVRHPVDWLGSWYRYRARPEIAGQKNSTRGVSFDAFVEAYVAEDRPSFAAVGSQAKFLGDKDGNLGVTHLFRYEAFDRAVAFLEARVGREVTLKRQNVSPEMALTLSPEVEATLRRKAPAEFDAWERAGG